MKIFIAGIDTNVGKTVVSATLQKAWGYDYWKPVQSGDLANSDTKTVKKLTSGLFKYHTETHKFKEPLSPHASSKLEGVEIKLNDFKLPKSDNLIIEGAGGLMVPLNEEGDCIIDLIKYLDAKVILVSKNYLGSINHTLLSCQLLNSYGIETLGIVIIGDKNEDSESIIEQISGVPILGHIDWTSRLSAKFIDTQIAKFKSVLEHERA